MGRAKMLSAVVSLGLMASAKAKGLAEAQATNARWYPACHISVPSGRISDPNGFSCFNGG